MLISQIQPISVQSLNQNIKPELESAGIVLGIIVSGIAITNVAISLVSKFNKLSTIVESIQTDLQTHIKEVIEISERYQRIDKRLDLHIQDYLHHKELTQMLVNQLNEKIDHKFNRINNSMHHIEKFLENDGSFRPKEFHDK